MAFIDGRINLILQWNASISAPVGRKCFGTEPIEAQHQQQAIVLFRNLKWSNEDSRVDLCLLIYFFLNLIHLKLRALVREESY